MHRRIECADGDWRDAIFHMKQKYLIDRFEAEMN